MNIESRDVENGKNLLIEIENKDYSFDSTKANELLNDSEKSNLDSYINQMKPQESKMLLAPVKDELSPFDIEKDIPLNKDNFLGIRREDEPRRLGNTWAFFYKNGEPRVIIGPHCKIVSLIIFYLGPFYICLSAFITGSCFIYFYFLWDMLNEYVKYFGLLIYFIQFSSYTYTAFANPGIPSKSMSSSNRQLVKNFRICNVCNVVMNLDDNTSHCEDCNVCVEGK